MTATLPDRPLSDAEAEADANSRRKGDLIGTYLHRCGLTVEDVNWLPLTDRRGPSRARLARAAYRAAGAEENPPHSLASDSWRYAREVLGSLAVREEFGFAPTPRDLLGERARWLAPTTPDGAPDEIPAAIPGPRGWGALAALGPLPDRVCSFCGRPAIVGTLDGWRCAGCPPLEARRGWGWALDWTPAPGRSCPPGTCWCGRHPHYVVAAPVLPGMRSLTYSHGFGPPAPAAPGPRLDAAARTG
jgi:hypothetical protein